MLLCNKLRSIIPAEYLVHPQVSLYTMLDAEHYGGSYPWQMDCAEFDIDHALVYTLNSLQVENGSDDAQFKGVFCYLEPSHLYHTVDFVFEAKSMPFGKGPFARDGTSASPASIQEWITEVSRCQSVSNLPHEHQNVDGRKYADPDGYCHRIRRYIGHDLMFTIGACALVIEDNRVLLQKRRDNCRWGPPGGSVEIGEQLADAAVREVREETGYDIAVLSLESIYSGPECSAEYPNGDRLRYISMGFYATAVGGTPIIENEETMKVDWFKLNELPDNLGPLSRAHIQEMTIGVNQIKLF